MTKCPEIPPELPCADASARWLPAIAETTLRGRNFHLQFYALGLLRSSWQDTYLFHIDILYQFSEKSKGNCGCIGNNWI